MWNEMLTWKHSEISHCLRDNQRSDHPALFYLQDALNRLTTCMLAAKRHTLEDKQAAAAIVYADFAACYFMDVNLCGDNAAFPQGFDEQLWLDYADGRIDLDTFREWKL